MVRVLYAGSPEASAVTLGILLEKSAECGFEIAGVLSNPPSAKGRHKALVPTPVAQLAEEKGIPVFTPEHLDSAAREAVQAVNADILAVFAYGHIFGPKFMSLFKFGGINLHPSALPEYRGCTPVNAAILNGNSKTAFTVQAISQKMDEGDILAQEEVVLNGTENALSLLNDAAVRGGKMISLLLKSVSENNSLPAGRSQQGEASYTGIITKDDAKLDWSKSSREIDCAVRAYYGDPSAWTLEKGLPLKIIEGKPLSDEEGTALGGSNNVAPGTVSVFAKSAGILVKCGSGFYAVTKLQRQGKNAMDYKSFMNGARDFVGTVLSV
ncbi:MAG: methionyl-tRNA formyltransferase [Treponema sp.]|nr:methionyl-tRNA formyltransferase [Treponema sp.]